MPMHESLQASAEYIDLDYQVENHKEYRLSIQLRLDGFSFAIIDPDRMQLMQLREYKLTERPGQSVENRWLGLQEYFQAFLNQQLIANTFQKIIIAADHKEYAVVPNVLFIEGKQREQLDFCQDIPYSFQTYDNQIPGTDRKLIGALSKPLYLSIYDYFHEPTIIHSNTVLQNEINKLHKNKKMGNRVYISVVNRDMHLIIMNNENLLMSNSFSFTSKEDFVYFILLGYDQLQLNPEIDPVYFLGDISRTSPIYQICWQYIKNIHFVDQTAGITAGSAFDQMPVHQYFTLIHSALCE